MKKKVNQRVVVFTKDYTNKLEGTVLKCDVVLASHLISIGVAKIHNEKEHQEPKEFIEKPIKKTKKK
jgi:hypothetical protein